MECTIRLSSVTAILLLLSVTSPAAAFSCYKSAAAEPSGQSIFSADKLENETATKTKVCAEQNFLLTAEGGSQLLPFTEEKAQQFRQAVLASLNFPASYPVDYVEVEEAPQVCMKGRVILQVRLQRARRMSAATVRQALARMELFFPGNGAHLVQDWFKGRLCRADSSGCIGPYVSALTPLPDCGVQVCLALDGSSYTLSAPAAWTSQAAIASSLMASMGPQNKNCDMAVMQFPKVSTPMVPLTSKMAELSPRQLSAMILKVGPAGGRFIPSKGVEACLKTLEAMPETQMPRRMVLLVTALPGPGERRRLLRATNRAKETGVEIMMIGGPGVPLDMMQQLASSPDKAIELHSATDAAAVLEVAVAAAQGLCAAGSQPA